MLYRRKRHADILRSMILLMPIRCYARYLSLRASSVYATPRIYVTLFDTYAADA